VVDNVVEHFVDNDFDNFADVDVVDKVIDSEVEL
jgi:hypothetical protein